MASHLSFKINKSSLKKGKSFVSQKGSFVLKMDRLFISQNGQVICPSKWTSNFSRSKRESHLSSVKVDFLFVSKRTFISPSKWTSYLSLKKGKSSAPRNGLVIMAICLLKWQVICALKKSHLSLKKLKLFVLQNWRVI